MFNNNTNTEYGDLRSLLDATRSSVTDTGEFEKLIPDIRKEVPTWECSGGVCILEWKPRKVEQ